LRMSQTPTVTMRIVPKIQRRICDGENRRVASWGDADSADANG
jgi:hypothetical protein